MGSVGSQGTDLDRLLGALRADPSPDELAGEGQAIISIAAWVRSHQVTPVPGLAMPRVGIRHGTRALTARVATSVISAAFVATSGLVVAGALPDPARRFASQFLVRIGVHGPLDVTEADSRGSSPRTGDGAPIGGSHEVPRAHRRVPPERHVRNEPPAPPEAPAVVPMSTQEPASSPPSTAEKGPSTGHGHKGRHKAKGHHKGKKGSGTGGDQGSGTGGEQGSGTGGDQGNQGTEDGDHGNGQDDHAGHDQEHDDDHGGSDD